MLRPPSSLAPWPGASSHPCARCGALTPGLRLGERCARCLRELTRRASRIGRLVAIVTTGLVAGYLILTLGAVPVAWRTTARTVGAVTVVVWYLLTFRIVKRIALEWLR